MRLENLTGDISVNPTSAATLIKTLFDPTDLLTISSKKINRGPGQNVLTQEVKASDLVGGLLRGGGGEWLYSLCTQPEPMDTYFGLAPLRPGAFRGMAKRVKSEDVSHIGLIYADLDVKPGGFISQQDALDFLRGLPYYPNCVVSSGSGGLHAYWRVEGFAGPRSINPHVGKDLLMHWWSFLVEAATGRNIDRLVDVTRMSRLPGTIRWPKPKEHAVPRPVELLYAQREGVINAIDLLHLTNGSWERLQETRKQVRKRDEKLSVDMSQVASNLSGGKWSRMLAVSQVEAWVDEHLPWDNILSPSGWTFLRADGEGRREWERPGGNGKSATTDWPESPNVMSLLSTSEDTGLIDLHDAEISLTKYRCMLRLNFDDNVEAAVSWVLAQMGS